MSDSALSKHNLHTLTVMQGVEVGVVYEVSGGTDEPYAAFIVPFKCKLVAASIVATTATSSATVNDMEIFNVTGTAIAGLAKAGINLAAVATTTVSITPTTPSTVYAANTVFHIRGTATTADPTITNCAASLVVENLEEA